MNSGLQEMKQRVRTREHRRFRLESSPDVLSECEREDLSWPRRVARLLSMQCEAERVIIEPDERIVYTRSLPSVPPVCSSDDWAKLTAGKVAHELGVINNICADWEMVLSQGLLGRREVALRTRERMADDPEAVEFLDSAIETIDAVLGLAARYAAAAREMGKEDVARALENVPANRPRSFHEALQSLRLCHAVLWIDGHYHCGLGRFDQYMWPYLSADLDSGALTTEAAQKLLAEFFIALNKDTDLFPGIQRGDNGQSIILGGVKRDGSSAINELTSMVLRVSRDVGMIDPKINLRVNSETDLDLLCPRDRTHPQGPRLSSVFQ